MQELPGGGIISFPPNEGNETPPEGADIADEGNRAASDQAGGTTATT